VSVQIDGEYARSAWMASHLEFGFPVRIRRLFGHLLRRRRRPSFPRAGLGAGFLGFGRLGGAGGGGPAGV
jgi:hypothetical protein